MEIPLGLKFDNRTKAGIIVGISAAALIADYLAERRKPTPIWKYRSNPPQPSDFDRYIRVLTNPLVNAIADGMIMHVWDAMSVPLNPQWTGIDLPGNPGERQKTHLLSNAHADTRWGWKRSYVLGVDLEKVAELGLTPEDWHYAYDIKPELGKIERDIEKCRIIMPLEEQARILVGPKPFTVFVLDTENNELPLKIVGKYFSVTSSYLTTLAPEERTLLLNQLHIHRADPQFKHIRLL